KGSEFRRDCERLMKRHDVKIQKANSKRSIGIVKRYNRTLAERLFRIQDVLDLLLPISEKSKVWVKNLPIIVKELNNSVTQLFKMTSAKAIQKK
ncbi:20954_t:CDS:1, partial [Cetraspora pellucida]